jgi:L-rhamnose mutarotase
MYDFNTKNISFIRMAKFLKDQGIKNYMFFLKLNDPALQGVDPYDPNLSDEMKIRIQVEVMTNFWYYLREVVRIPESGGSTEFLLHRANLGQMFLMEHNIDLIEVLPRQHGKTIGAVCRYTWVYHWGTTNSHMIFSNKQYNDSQLNIKRFNDITELLPSYLKGHLNPKLDTNNLAAIACDKNNNKIDAMSTANDIASADKLGRGNTVPIIWYDEFAFLKYNSTIYTAAAPAFSRASKSAMKNGTPYGKLITTTPNDLDTEIGSYCYSMIQDACPFDEAWYDWDIKELKTFIKENSKNRFVYLEFSYKELGNDEEWFEEQCAQLNNDLLKIKREILLEWTLANDTSPFSEEQLGGISEHAGDPIGKFYIMKKYKFEIFDDMKNIPRKSWMVGIDVGGGLKRDYTAVTITDPKDMKIKAEFKSNGISVPDLASLLVHLVTDFMPNAVLIPERNTLGIALIQILMKSEVADNMYYEVREKEGEKVVEDPKHSTKRKVKSQTRVYGIHTGSNSARNGTRDIMINEILNNAVNETPWVFTSKNVYKEIRTLERDKKGKVEHRQGAHDDLLFSWLVACYALLYGKSSGKFFKVLSDGVETEEDRQKNNRVVKNISNLSRITNNTPSTLSDVMIEKYQSIDHFSQNEESDNSVRKKRRMRGLNFIAGLNK